MAAFFEVEPMCQNLIYVCILQSCKSLHAKSKVSLTRLGTYPDYNGIQHALASHCCHIAIGLRSHITKLLPQLCTQAVSSFCQSLFL